MYTPPKKNLYLLYRMSFIRVKMYTHEIYSRFSNIGNVFKLFLVL